MKDSGKTVAKRGRPKKKPHSSHCLMCKVKTRPLLHRNLCRLCYRKQLYKESFDPKKNKKRCIECEEVKSGYADKEICVLCVRKINSGRSPDSPPLRAKKGSGFVSDGYKYVWRDKRSVPEHRVVVEEHLGRKLYADECIYHKNNIRNDNRLENLEVMSFSKPSSFRIEDKISWAIAFLQKYGHQVITK